VCVCVCARNRAISHCRPVSPVKPIGPRGPVAPPNPTCPLWPRSEDRPGAPFGPGSPIEPRGPSTPFSPGDPTLPTEPSLPGVPVHRHITACMISLIRDLLFLPISTIESRVSYRVVTHSRDLFTLEWTHPAIQACLFHTTMVTELS